MVRKKTTAQFIIDAKLIHSDRYDYSLVDYKTNKIKVIIICNLHGEFKQIPRGHLSGKGCHSCGHNNYTTAEWIIKAKVVHGDRYDYSLVDYKTNKIKVIIICNTHGEFKQEPNNHLRSVGCPSCGNNTYTTAQFIIEAKVVHSDKYDYSLVNYTNCETKVIIICNTHGEFKQIPRSHLKGYGCIKCGGKYNYNTAEWIIEAKGVHSDRYDYSLVDYKTNNIKVIIICNTHGEFKQIPRSHLSGVGCSKCGGTYNYNTAEWIIEAKGVHSDKYDYSLVDYKTSRIKVVIFCNLHGEFKQIPRSHLSGNGCPKCGNNNVSENCCRDIITNHMEVEFPNVRPEFMGGLELDGYNEEYQIAFEYQGIQHYEFVPLWHKTIDGLIAQQVRDTRKKEILKLANIHLIEIDGRKYNRTNLIELEKHIIEQLMNWYDLFN
jgi:desulfoferrodoxin (superoxide reductase-like protein)